MLTFFEYENNAYFIFVDSYSKWMDVQLMRKTDTASTITCLKHWFSIYGLPNQLISDNGTQFTSEEFAKFMKLKGIKHICIAAYHQSSTGHAERYVQIVKKGMKCSSTSNLKEHVDQILLAHRSTPSSATGKTPSRLFLGREMQIRLDIMKPKPQIEVTHTPPSNNKNRQAPTRNLEVGDMVQIR